MDSFSSVSPSIVLPHSNPIRLRHSRFTFSSISLLLRNPSSCGVRYSRKYYKRKFVQVSSKLGAGEEEDEDVERALHMDGTIPGTSDQFVKQVSSRAYDMRRHLHQTFDGSSYDVLEANPWRDSSKPVYVLTQRENQLCTMKTRRNHSEVERELGLLFSEAGKRRSDIPKKAKESRSGTKFQMLVEDVREGVLVFEDEKEAAKYCDLLQGGGKGCEGVAEIEASSVFDLCQKMRALAVLFRRGMTPPLPQSLELNLRARKRSLEDEEDLM